MGPVFITDIYAAVFVGTVFLAVLCMVGVLALVAERDTPAGEKRMRDRLGKRLANTRMWQMLEHRQISPLHYVDRMPIADLREQIKACEHCAKQQMCDEMMSYVGVRKRNFGFCPNRRAMDEIAHQRTHE